MNLIDKCLNKCYSDEGDNACSENVLLLELSLFLDVCKVRHRAVLSTVSHKLRPLPYWAKSQKRDPVSTLNHHESSKSVTHIFLNLLSAVLTNYAITLVLYRVLGLTF
jgi:hypothetical protein